MRFVQTVGALALAAAACFAGAQATAAQETPAVLTPETLANMEYRSEVAANGTALLEDGVYSETVEGMGVVTVELREEPRAAGTVDGREAAAVLIVENGGGTGRFNYLALVVDQEGAPVNTSNAFLGDRVRVTALDLRADGTVAVGLIQQGENDPFCCPTLPTMLTYSVVGDQLAFEQGATAALDASGVSETVQATVLPAVPDAWEAPPGALPQRIVYSLDGTDPATVMETGRTAYVGVYPVDEWVDLWAGQEPNVVAETVGNLQMLLGTQPDAPAPPMPLLPPFAAFNDLVTQVRYLNLPNAVGVRFVGRVTQVQEPVAAEELAYYFMGLTAGAEHVIMARVPLDTELLPATSFDVPAATVDAAMADFDAYRSGVEETLNGAADGDFTPALDALDAMIQSIDVRSEANVLAPAALGNITYRSQLATGGVAPLVNGVYTEAVGSELDDIVVQLSSPLAYGTLFGLDAAAVTLVESGGGGGTIISLALVVDANGVPVNIASVPLGDPVYVNRLTIADDAIAVDMRVAGPDDPLCCPSQPVTQLFELGLNAVTPGGLPLPVDIGGGTGAGAPDETPALAGTTWVWVNTQMGDGANITPEDPAAFTLTFGDDGGFGSTTDCNSVAGQFTADEATGQLAFGEIASTRMACEGETLESTYITQLSGAASYLVRDGQLYIALQFDSGIMEFAPAE